MLTITSDLNVACVMHAVKIKTVWRKTKSYDVTHMWNLIFFFLMIQMNFLQKRNRLTNLEDEFMATEKEM